MYSHWLSDWSLFRHVSYAIVLLSAFYTIWILWLEDTQAIFTTLGLMLSIVVWVEGEIVPIVDSTLEKIRLFIFEWIVVVREEWCFSL